jgi:hypothetical protein
MEEQRDLQKEIYVETLLCYQYGWKQHPNYKKEGKCDICLDDSMIGCYVLETKCGHTYHQSCIIMTLLNKFLKCPSCMKPYVKD